MRTDRGSRIFLNFVKSLSTSPFAKGEDVLVFKSILNPLSSKGGKEGGFKTSLIFVILSFREKEKGEEFFSSIC
jgi:hypothetical protein